jgi:uncharacterized membrane protein
LKNNQKIQEKTLRRLFDFGVAIKGIDGVLEIIGGLLFLFISQSSLNGIVITLTQHELFEDPDDLIANALRHAFSGLTVSGKLFGSTYLLAHGFCKVFLVVCLLRNKLWSYPVAIIFLTCFVAFQLYWMQSHFSWGITILTGADILIIMLIWHEYRYLKYREDSD